MIKRARWQHQKPVLEETKAESEDFSFVWLLARQQIMKELNFIDLFSGTGAFSHVLEKLGHKCVLSNDMVKESYEIYKLNMDHKVFKLKNLNDCDVLTEIPQHDILCAGFPCQPFSIAGEKKGFKDERSNVFWKIIEILSFVDLTQLRNYIRT